MKTINVSIASTNRWKSCGQNAIPNMINFRSKMLNNIRGCPLIFINGPLNNNASRTELTIVLLLYKGPLGFLGKIQFRLPSLLIVAMLSRKDSWSFLPVASDEMLTLFYLLDFILLLPWQHYQQQGQQLCYPLVLSRQPTCRLVGLCHWQVLFLVNLIRSSLLPEFS